ncbi:hypothetical protein BCS42_01745 [Crenothrix sp. D3]|nr:hypothetical protein BCS42_01745 [Crenothrix sp. D3]
MDLHALKAQRVVYGTGNPAWGVVTDSGAPLLSIRPATVDHRQSGIDKLRINTEATVVEFIDSGTPKRFSLPATQYGSAEALVAPKTTAEGLVLTDWEDNTAPKLNGKPLKLDPYERSRSLAISPDEQHFVLGTEWWLRFFDRDGKELWNAPIPSVSWTVNISADQRFVVAAFADGTIRWYSLKTGKEQLAFFPLKGSDEWVLWTPEGFFNASPHGKDLIGYAVNQGQNKAARFVSVQQMSEVFYRPDLIAKRLEQTEDAEQLITAALANNTLAKVLEEPAPRLELVSKTRKGLAMILKVRVSDQGGGVGKVNYTLNGVEQQGRQIFPGIEGTKPADIEINVPLAQGVNVIKLFGTNRNNTLSSDLPSFEENLGIEQLKKSSLYVLALGVSRYQNPNLSPLKFADADATALATALDEGGENLFKERHVVTLVNEQVTLQSINDSFAKMAKAVERGDVFVLYMAWRGNRWQL